MTGMVDVAGLAGGHVSLTADQLDELGARVTGPLLRAGDKGFDEAVLVWNGMVARTPALVVQPTTARDVVTAVRFARDHGLLLSVKGGGHNIAGTSLAEGGLTLDMSRMRQITVDPDAKLAHVGPGSLLTDVDHATQAHGLATVLGFISETGVAGLTLGGGLGYLTRRFGWTVDNLDEVEIVTADCEIRTANRAQNAELFWAIRGAGANLGVVTRFTFRLHNVGPTIYGGLIAWPFDRAEEILAAYRQITTAAPRELAVWLILLRAPAAPFVPEPWHGKRIAAMAVCYTGNPNDVENVLAPIRTLDEPIVDEDLRAGMWMLLAEHAGGSASTARVDPTRSLLSNVQTMSGDTACKMLRAKVIDARGIEAALEVGYVRLQLLLPRGSICPGSAPARARLPARCRLLRGTDGQPAASSEHQ